MTIYRDQNEFIWIRRNKPFQRDALLALFCVADGVTIGRSGLDSDDPQFTKDQFVEMIKAGAEHFNLRLTIEEIPIVTCPNCNGIVFDYLMGQEDGRVKKFCEACGLSGPFGNSREEADQAWDVFFHQTNRSSRHPSPVSIQEELNRR